MIHHSGVVVIMDSGFCVLQALVKLATSGVYLSAVIKKQWYWPKYKFELIFLRLSSNSKFLQQRAKCTRPGKLVVPYRTLAGKHTRIDSWWDLNVEIPYLLCCQI